MCPCSSTHSAEAQRLVANLTLACACSQMPARPARARWQAALWTRADQGGELDTPPPPLPPGPRVGRTLGASASRLLCRLHGPRLHGQMQRPSGLLCAHLPELVGGGASARATGGAMHAPGRGARSCRRSSISSPRAEQGPTHRLYHHEPGRMQRICIQHCSPGSGSKPKTIALNTLHDRSARIQPNARSSTHNSTRPDVEQ